MPTTRRAARAMRKVPELTIFFWIIKLLTTAMGESTSDYLVHQIDPVIAVALGGVCFLAAILLQFAVRRYVAPVYWLAVLMVAVFGTMDADVLHIGLGIPYVVSTAFFSVALIVVFALWYARERTLSIHSINTLPREMFYWAAVLTTFALGTAAGDMTAMTLSLGYFLAGVAFAILFVLPALAYRLFGLDAIASFWLAYIVTRPVGGSFADWMGRTPALGGIGVGQGQVSLVLAVLIAGFVAYLTFTRVDIRDERIESPAEDGSQSSLAGAPGGNRPTGARRVPPRIPLAEGHREGIVEGWPAQSAAGHIGTGFRAALVRERPRW